MSTNAQEPEKTEGTNDQAPPTDAAEEIVSEIEKLEGTFKEEKEKMAKELQEASVS